MNVKINCLRSYQVEQARGCNVMMKAARTEEYKWQVM